MKVFHDSMARRFGSPTTANLATLKVDAELASCAVAELLAPYRAESGTLKKAEIAKCIFRFLGCFIYRSNI